MTSLTQIQFEDDQGNTFDVFVQIPETQSTEASPPSQPSSPQSQNDDDEYEEAMGLKDLAHSAVQQVKKVSLKAVHTTIQTYTKIAIGAFQNLPGVDVEEVTLKFGIAIEGTTGMPILMGGSAGANFEIEVKCKPKGAKADG